MQNIQRILGEKLGLALQLSEVRVYQSRRLASPLY